MKKSTVCNFKEERAQSLVIVLLMLVIAVIIAVAISYRTIQDIRRAGEEKASSRAGTLAESILDVITSTGTFESVVEDCMSAWAVGEVCEIDQTALETHYLGSDAMEGYSDAGVMLRPEEGINDLLVEKDDVLELDLSGVTGPEDICISWENTAGPAVQYVTVRVFKLEDGCVADAEGNLDCVDSAHSLTYTNPSSWGSSDMTVLAPGNCGTVGFSGDAWVARIRPYGGSASITITSLPDDFPVHIASVKSYVYTEGADGGQIYREFLRRVTVHPSLPAVFDYVLFNGEGAVVK